MKWIVIHHSAFPDPSGPRAILRFHLDEYRYADIGYHFVIDREGNIWEGRDIRTMGGHAGVSLESIARARAIRKGEESGTVDDARKLDPDWGSVGIVVDGWFYSMMPTMEQVQSLSLLVQHLLRRYEIPPDHVITHQEVRERIVKAKGLTPGSKTPNCPGPNLQPLVEALRDRAGGATTDNADASASIVAIVGAIRRHAPDLAYWHIDRLRRGEGAVDAPVTIRFVLNRSGRVLASRVESDCPLDEWFRNGLLQAFNRIEFPPQASRGLLWYECRFRFDILEGS